MMKLAMVADSAVVHQAMTRLLRSVDGVALVGFAADVGGAVDVIDSQLPDMVLLDVELRGGGRGMTVLRHTVRNHPATDVVVMSPFGWQSMRVGFMQAGAKAYFDPATEFVAARDWVVRRCIARSALKEPLTPGLQPGDLVRDPIRIFASSDRVSASAG